MKIIYITIFCILIFHHAFCQKKSKISDSTILVVDSVVTEGLDYKLVHFHQVSRQIERKILSDTKDSIFEETFNQFSRLQFKTKNNYFDIPTIPLTHLIYLEQAGLILGLSKIAISPYRVVLYTVDGKLIQKVSLNSFELKMEKSEIKELLKTYPNVSNCLPDMSIVKSRNFYYLELTRCILEVLGAETIRKMKTLTPNHYFPYMSHATSPWDFRYVRYHKFISDSDPFHELITIGSVPYILVLNSESGARVYVPLVNNYKIIDELLK